jgi:hypothetical protein
MAALEPSLSREVGSGTMVARVDGYIAFCLGQKHVHRGTRSVGYRQNPSWVQLGKWRYCECSICSSASCRSTTKASQVAPLMPPSSVHLGVEASTTWRMWWT